MAESEGVGRNLQDHAMVSEGATVLPPMQSETLMFSRSVAVRPANLGSITIAAYQDHPNASCELANANNLLSF